MEENKWTVHIKARQSLFSLDFKELYRYRGLIGMFVKRYFSTMYKQTILGPLWLVLNPFLTTVFFTLVFGNIAKIGTDGIPHMVFYMGGTTLWSLFSGALNDASSTFITNSSMFSKVYFPRLTAPIASTICNLCNYLIQFLMYLGFFFYYYFTGAPLHPNAVLWLLPVLVLQLAVFGTGVGLVISALTTKYKDLKVLVTFALQLWMYATPVVYPLSTASGLLRTVLLLNPVTSIVELFRLGFTGVGEPLWGDWVYSLGVTAVVALLGILLFNRTEKYFVDTI